MDLPRLLSDQKPLPTNDFSRQTTKYAEARVRQQGEVRFAEPSAFLATGKTSPNFPVSKIELFLKIGTVEFRLIQMSLGVFPPPACAVTLGRVKDDSLYVSRQFVF